MILYRKGEGVNTSRPASLYNINPAKVIRTSAAQIRFESTISVFLWFKSLWS
jgi:hypothetical protein